MGGGGRAAHVHDFDSLSCCFPPPHRRTLQQIPPSFGRITLTLVWCKLVLLYLFLLCLEEKLQLSFQHNLSSVQISGQVLLHLPNCLLAPRPARAVLPESTKGEGGGERGVWAGRGQTRVRWGSLKAKEFKFLFILFLKEKQCNISLDAEMKASS